MSIQDRKFRLIEDKNERGHFFREWKQRERIVLRFCILAILVFILSNILIRIFKCIECLKLR